MGSLILVSNLIEALLWIVGGVILLSVKTVLPKACDYPYRRAKRYLAATFFIGAVPIVVAFGVGKFSGGRIEFLSIYSLIVFYIGLATTLLSFISLYNSRKLTRRSLLWIFGPILGLIVLSGIAAAVWGSPRVYSFDEYLEVVGSSPTLMIRTSILVAVVVGVVAVVGKYLRARKAYNDMLNDYYSGEEEIRRARWIDRFFQFILVTFAFVAASAVVIFPYFDLAYRIVLCAGMVYLLVKFIDYQSAFSLLAPAMEYAAQSEHAAKEAPDRLVGVRLQQWMWREDKPFLTGGLSLNDVSRMSGVDKRKLSAHINIKYKMTFNSWINMLRTQEVERILADNAWAGRNLSEISEYAGFADLAAMSNAFKKINGVSPSAFRKSRKTL